MVSIISRNSHPEMFLRKGVLKICSKFTGEHLSRSVISIKLLNFPINLLHIFRTPLPRNTSGWLLLIQSNINNNTLMLLPNALRRSWIYQMLPFIFSQDISPIRNKVPVREFCWSVDREFYSRLGIWNCISVWSADEFAWKLMLLCKNESSLKKEKSFSEGFFFKQVEISSLQESFQDESSGTKFIYQMLPWISCEVT